MKELKRSMKTVLSGTAMVTFSLSALQAQGELANAVKVASVDGAKAVNLYISDPSNAPYEVAILNEQRTEVWSETYLGSMARSIVLEQLPEGRYNMVVKDEDEYFELPLDVNGDKSVTMDRRTFKKSPTVAVRGKSVLVDYNRETENSPVAIAIYDPQGRVLHQSTVRDPRTRMTRFDMSQLESGDYEIVLSIEGNSFTRKVRVD